MAGIDNESEIQKFYAGKSVLLTGVTGFLGKVMAEKLLYSVPNLGNVYCLIRPQKGRDAKERLDHIVQSVLYDRIRNDCPDRLDKLIAIAGDLQEPELGLSHEDKQRLCNDVSVVYHCAATVKFDEVLSVSIELNVVGTQKLLALCHKMKKMAALVHVSTAYANCDRQRIVESVYPPPVHPHKLIEAMSWMTEDMVATLTPLMVGRRPNTYTFTKAVAESLLVEDGDDLPVVIVRPSIVGSTCAEPIVGWTDNLNGATGLFAAVGKGVLTNMCGDVTARADIIPVDIVANLLIASAWWRGTTRHESIPVINCCSGKLNPVRWAFIVDYLEHFYNIIPLEGAFRYPSTTFHHNRQVYNLHVNLKHYIPAYFIDFLYRITGRKPRMVRLYSRLMKVVETLHHFTTREWDFQSKRVVEVWDSMTKQDQKLFHFDIRQLDWNHYLHDYMLGVKRYMLKDDMLSLDGPLAHITRLRILSLAINTLVTGTFIHYFAPKKWTQKNRSLIFIAASIVQAYFILQHKTVGKEPRLDLYGQSFGSKDALTLTKSYTNLKVLDFK